MVTQITYMYRCNHCGSLTYKPGNCCGYTRTNITADANVSICKSCGTLYRDGKTCRAHEDQMQEIGSPPLTLEMVLEDMWATQTEVLKAVEKANLMDVPKEDTLKKMQELIKTGENMNKALPHCLEKVKIGNMVKAMTEMYQKWILITNVFRKMGDANFITKIEKVSNYIDTLNEEQRGSTEILSNCAEVETMSNDD